MRLKRHLENWLWIVPLVAVVLLVPPPSSTFGAKLPDALWDGFGMVLIVLGAIVRTCARGWKHEQGKEELVTTGPYARIRHPLYFGTLLCGVGVCMIHGSPWLFGAFALSFVLWYAFVIRREETRLAARWPEAHAAYRRSVPLLFPSPRGIGALLSAWPDDVWKSISLEADALFFWPLTALAIRIWEVAGSPELWKENRTQAIALISVLVITGVVWLCVKHGPLARAASKTNAP
jgi:protein-S-isoprenylcysteine O-methyltransferase Ste14